MSEANFALGTLITNRLTYVPLCAFERLANRSKYCLEHRRVADLPQAAGAFCAVPR